MFAEKIPSGKLAAWICAALIPVLLQSSAGMSWPASALVGAACSAAVWMVWRWGKEPGRWCSAFRLLYTIVVMGELLPLAAQIWPGGDQYPAVPLLILALAAWSAQKGPTASARVGCVLFWFVLIMYLAVLGIGISSVKWKWIAPQSGPVRPLAALLLLIPAGAAAVKKERSGWKPRLLLPGLLLLSASMITFGVLSAKLAAGSENAFFDLSRSLEIAGTARRFEAVISAGMTVGWFSLLSLCLVLCAQSAGRIHERAARPAVYLAAAMSAGYMLLKTPISETFLLILGAVFWVVLPLLTQGIEKLKKS